MLQHTLRDARHREDDELGRDVDEVDLLGGELCGDAAASLGMGMTFGRVMLRVVLAVVRMSVVVLGVDIHVVGTTIVVLGLGAAVV